MAKMMIFEGPDGGGKTTLIEKLTEKTGILRWHSGGPINTQNELLTRLTGLVKSRKEDFYYYDRHCCISEPVYGEVIRGKAILPLEAFICILKSFDPIIFYVRPNRIVLRERRDEGINIFKSHKSQKYIDSMINQYDKIVDKYDEVMKVFSSHFLVLKIDPTTSEDLIVKILSTGGK